MPAVVACQEIQGGSAQPAPACPGEVLLPGERGRAGSAAELRDKEAPVCRVLPVPSTQPAVFPRKLGTMLKVQPSCAAMPADGRCMLRVGMTNPPFILEHLEDIAAILCDDRVFSYLHVPVRAVATASCCRPASNHWEGQSRGLCSCGFHVMAPELLCCAGQASCHCCRGRPGTKELTTSAPHLPPATRRSRAALMPS